MSWHYSQELAAAYSEGTCLDGEQCAPLKSSPSVVKFSSDASWMDVYRRSLSGTMYARSTASRGEGASMSSVAGFPARIFPPLGVEQASKDHALASGHTWHESSVRYDLATSSWRTHRCLFDEGLPWSSVTLPRWGLMRGGVCWGLTIAERRTEGSEFGSWPTPTARDWKSGKASAETLARNARPLSEMVFWQTPVADDAVNRKSGKVNSRGEPKLSAQVKYPTPRSADYKGEVSKTDCTARRVENGQANLPEFVQELGGQQTRQMWPTPTASEEKYRLQGNSQQSRSLEALARTGRMWPTPRAFMYKDSKHDSGKSNLGEVVWTTPCASDTAHQTKKYKQGGTPTSMQASGALNPDWVEWLMAWPIGWTACEPLATARFQSWLRLHGAFSEAQSETVRIKEGEA